MTKRDIDMRFLLDRIRQVQRAMESSRSLNQKPRFYVCAKVRFLTVLGDGLQHSCNALGSCMMGMDFNGTMIPECFWGTSMLACNAIDENLQQRPTKLL